MTGILGFGGGDIAPGEASVFLQYKGTDVCLDFICGECGAEGHFDGDFTYHLRCPKCSKVFIMPYALRLLPLPLDDPKYEFHAQYAKVPELAEEDGL